MKQCIRNKLSGITRRINRITSTVYDDQTKFFNDMNALRQSIENLLTWVCFAAEVIEWPVAEVDPYER